MKKLPVTEEMFSLFSNYEEDGEHYGPDHDEFYAIGGLVGTYGDYMVSEYLTNPERPDSMEACGLIITKNDEVVKIITIYDIYGLRISDKGLLTVCDNDFITNLFFDDLSVEIVEIG